MTNAWQEYKKKIASSPAGLLNPFNYISDETAQSRLDVCNGCDSFFQETKRCRECGCFMKLKVKLKEAVCPLGKW